MPYPLIYCNRVKDVLKGRERTHKIVNVHCYLKKCGAVWDEVFKDKGRNEELKKVREIFRGAVSADNLGTFLENFEGTYSEFIKKNTSAERRLKKLK